jgi:hypothetical protein
VTGPFNPQRLVSPASLTIAAAASVIPISTASLAIPLLMRLATSVRKQRRLGEPVGSVSEETDRGTTFRT